MEGRAERVHGADDAIGFEATGGEAIFMGNYKLTRNGPPYGDGQWRLINLREDPTESTDLSAIEPVRFQRMLAEVEAYHQHVGVVLPEPGYDPLRQLLRNNWQVLVRQLWFVLLPVARRRRQDSPGGLSAVSSCLRCPGNAGRLAHCPPPGRP